MLGKIFAARWHDLELEQEMARVLRHNGSPEAQRILRHGLWDELGRQYFQSRSKACSPQDKRIFKAVWTRSYICGQTLHKWGYKCDGRCKRCDLGSPDTVYHRAWMCPSGEKAAETEEEKALRAVAKAAGGESTLYSNLWLAKPKVSQPTEENLTWHVDSKLNVVPEFNFKDPKGHLFGDGSCYGGTCALTARAGWVVVETHDAGQLLRGKYGVLPKECQRAASAG